MTASHPAALRVLFVAEPGAPAWEEAAAALSGSPYGPFEVERCMGQEAATERLAEAGFDAVVAPALAAHWPGLSQAALNAAVVLAGAAVEREELHRLVGLGVQDLLPNLDADTLARALRLACERKQVEREARKAYATDLATGLPNHTQLVEHMSHLLALREREPAPMALLVLRLEGLQTVGVQLGRESANVLRRKVAVRLRAGVRASDVVAALGGDAFAVLLSAIEEPAHAQRVVEKLSIALHQPFNVTGHAVGVAVAVGAALYPADGKQADTLLRRASGAAATAPAQGRAGFANRTEGGMAQAANDDDAAID